MGIGDRSDVVSGYFFFLSVVDVMLEFVSYTYYFFQGILRMYMLRIHYLFLFEEGQNFLKLD